MPKPIFRPGISLRGWVSLLLISVVFWSLVFICCSHPWLLINYLIAYVVLIFVRCLLKPVPPKSDPLSEL